MKKLFGFISSSMIMAIIVMAASIGSASGQSGKKLAAPVPDDVSKIVMNSCMPCHGSNGGVMAKTKLDFSKWTEYTANTAAEKAGKICTLITEEKMPPKKARESKPEIVPTKEQVDLICKWAETLKPMEPKM
jgi:hypothetical protein